MASLVLIFDRKDNEGFYALNVFNWEHFILIKIFGMNSVVLLRVIFRIRTKYRSTKHMQDKSKQKYCFKESDIFSYKNPYKTIK